MARYNREDEGFMSTTARFRMILIVLYLRFVLPIRSRLEDFFCPDTARFPLERFYRGDVPGVLSFYDVHHNLYRWLTLMLLPQIFAVLVLVLGDGRAVSPEQILPPERLVLFRVLVLSGLLYTSLRILKGWGELRSLFALFSSVFLNDSSRIRDLDGFAAVFRQEASADRFQERTRGYEYNYQLVEQYFENNTYEAILRRAMFCVLGLQLGMSLLVMVPGIPTVVLLGLLLSAHLFAGKFTAVRYHAHVLQADIRRARAARNREGREDREVDDSIPPF